MIIDILQSATLILIGISAMLTNRKLDKLARDHKTLVEETRQAFDEWAEDAR